MLNINSIILFGYLLLLLIIALYNRSNSNNFNDYTKAIGKISKNKLILVATIFASSIGGGTTFGITTKIYEGEISYSFALIVAIISDILIVMYILPKLIKKHNKDHTVGDIMYHYYGNTGRYIGALATIAVSSGLLAAQLNVSGYIFAYVTNIEHIYAVILSYLIVTIYTTYGGIRSIISANQLQFVAIAVALPVLMIFALKNITIDNFVQNINDNKNYFFKENILKDTLLLSLGFSLMNLYPSFIQRILLNKEVKHVQNVVYMKLGVYLIFVCIITVNGIAATQLFPNYNPTIIIPHMINEILPYTIQGIILVGLLSTVMSTADSDLHIISTTISKDIISPIYQIKTQKQLLYITKFINLICGIIAIIVATQFDNIVQLVIFISGFWAPVIFVPLIFGLYDKILPEKLVIIPVISGFGSFLIYEACFKLNKLNGIVIGTLTSLIIFISCYILCKYFIHKDKFSYNNKTLKSNE